MSHESGRLTPRQMRTLDEVLALGGERPTCPSELVGELREHLRRETAPTVSAWTERSLYVTKSQLLTAVRCEGQLKAEAEKPRTGGMHPATAVGIVAHKAVQLSYTHPGRAVAEYVRASMVGARSADEALDEWWAKLDPAAQSDLLVQAASRVTGFLDDWPALDPAWSPRFEEPMVAKIGKLTLSARPDLVIGRPRSDMRQSMLICDLKSGQLHDEHETEAMFYALVATLRHEVAPWRSMVYSLASAEYTEPDVTPERLWEFGTLLVKGVRSIVDTLTEARDLELRPGRQCTWCPAKASCPAAGGEVVMLGMPF